VSAPAQPGVIVDEEPTVDGGPDHYKVLPHKPKLSPRPLLKESGIFADLNRDFGNAITAVLRAMQESDIHVGKVTVAVDIEAQIGSGNIEPKFEYKVGKQLVCKSERKGEIKPKGRFEWVDEKEDFVFIEDVDPQTDLFDAEDEEEAEPVEAEAEPEESTALAVRGADGEAD